MQRWANVLELRSDLEKYDLLSPGEALPTYLEQVALVADVDALDNSDQGSVTLITLHSAKGLEFPVVFIAGVEDGLLPISRAVEVEFSDPLPLEEERRLFYVGITRAEKLLYLTYAAARMMYGRYQQANRSRFLDAVPQENVRSLGTRGTTSRSGRSTLSERTRGTAPRPMPETREPAAVATPPVTRHFTIGERVFHAKFGEGVIAQTEQKRDDQELAINFIRHGTKRLLASFAKLDVLED
jgi:DNA helicase-2/ATP-dependent DNA helicase PcrA